MSGAVIGTVIVAVIGAAAGLASRLLDRRKVDAETDSVARCCAALR